jgi:hypothetical protein
MFSAQLYSPEFYVRMNIHSRSRMINPASPKGPPLPVHPGRSALVTNRNPPRHPHGVELSMKMLKGHNPSDRPSELGALNHLLSPPNSPRHTPVTNSSLLRRLHAFETPLTKVKAQDPPDPGELDAVIRLLMHQTLEGGFAGPTR